MTRALAALAALAGASAALVLAALLHLDTAIGRRALGDALEAWIGAEIQGDLRIGHVDEVGRDRIVARDVLFTSPAGDPALRLDHVVIDPAPSRLFSESTIAMRSAHIEGAHLWMIEDPDGLRIEQTLDTPPRPESGPPSRFLDFERIRFEGLDAEWRLHGAPRFEITEASGFLHVRTDRRGNSVLRFDRIEGRAEFHLPITPVSAGVRRASGRVHAGFARVAAFDVELDVGGSPLEIALDLEKQGDGVEVHADLGAHGPVPWLAALGVDLATELHGGFPGDVDPGLGSPPRELGDPSR